MAVSKFIQSLVVISYLIANAGIGTVHAAEARQTECAGELCEFKDTSSGIKLKYPRGWSVKVRPEKDSLARFSGKPAPNVEADISVSLLDNVGLKVEDFVKVFNDLMFSKLSGVRKSSLQRIYVGASARIPGQMQSVSFTMHGMPMYQEYVFVPAKGKMLVVALTTQNWQREPVEASWKVVLSSIDAPESFITLASASTVAQFKSKTSTKVCDTYSNSVCAPIRKPSKSMSLDQKINAVLPMSEEERFLQIPWQTDLLLARAQSERTGKPMFIWIMDGNVLGAT